ncbi:MAG: galactokinase [Saprospiraceae bacterium]|nr:galactokinase [Saprospiraceae bacterium]
MPKKKMIRSRAPGRINIIGEHTDYNNGFVFPAAISHYTEALFTLNDHDHICKIYSEVLQEGFTCDLRELGIRQKTWENYLVGVMGVLINQGYKLRGFDCEIKSNVPIGGGVSSSAALECSFIFGLNALFDLNLTRIEMARICQKADHQYVGVMSGIMDQFASMMGKADHAIHLDCQSLEYKHHKIELDDYSFFLINTNVHHELASSEYNRRQTECKEAVDTIKSRCNSVQSLRDISLNMLEEFKSQMNSIAYKRALHVINENERVQLSIEALKENDLIKLGQLMYASHHSLCTLYEVSCDELDFLVEQSKSFDSILGARMMGGGFGGCVLFLLKEDDIEAVDKNMKELFENRFGYKPSPLKIEIGQGAVLC